MGKTPRIRGGIVVAKDTVNVTHDGQRVHIERGTAWVADDPLVQQYPDLFTDDERYVHRTTRAPGLDGIETATRRPGERRGVRRG